MNSTFSFFNLFLAYISNRNPECPHILYNEDIDAKCCQNEILKVHNGIRATITPWWADQGFPNMTWDGGLAIQAQNVVRKCKFKQEPVGNGRFPVNQNMYLKCSKTDDIEANWSEPIHYWFSEDKIRPNYASNPGETGQTQWKKLHTLLTGCGYGNYKINETDFFTEKGVGVRTVDSSKDFCQMYICLYGPM